MFVRASMYLIFVHFQVRLTGEPTFLGEKTFGGDDWQFFVPAKVYVKWPQVVVFPEKRGRASAFVLDASKNFENL